MSKEIKNIEENENVNEEAVEMTETKQTIGSKIVGGAKKHGKKILGIVGVGAAMVLAYALGKKSAGECDGCFEEDVAGPEDFDVEFEEVDPE